MVEYMLSLQGVRDTKFEDGTTAFSMALARKDLEMIRVFLRSEHLSDISPSELVKRSILEIDRHPCSVDSDLRKELWNYMRMHEVNVQRRAPIEAPLSDE